MKLSPPKVVTWYIALALVVLALLGSAGIIGALNPYAFILAVAAAVLLLLASFLKGL
ncbi:MAG: hypothetical protein HPY76_05390 [Anaerolineae bacterium]|jgi:fatty acid desaturase|nr:hypothetical protein [Anaerolineae bacterium]